MANESELEYLCGRPIIPGPLCHPSASACHRFACRAWTTGQLATECVCARGKHDEMVDASPRVRIRGFANEHAT